MLQKHLIFSILYIFLLPPEYFFFIFYFFLFPRPQKHKTTTRSNSNGQEIGRSSKTIYVITCTAI